MKKALLSSLVTCIASFTFAQWANIYGGIEGPTLRSVYFLSETVGYIAGGVETVGEPGSSTIFKTIDGGLNWVELPTPLDTGLRAIHCIDLSTCIACGYSGNILKTTDSGATWVLIPSGTTQTLRSIDFVTSKIGFISGGLGTILKTIDGGQTWVPIINSGTAQDIINVRFADETIGYCVSSSSSFSDGIVLKTTDGGDNWTGVYTNIDGLLGLAVVDENIVYAGGGNTLNGTPSFILKSVDGGSTWNQVYAGIANAPFRGASFTSSSEGWFVGDAGQVVGTVDGGVTWTADPVTTLGVLGIHMLNPAIGYAAGQLSLILKHGSLACAQPTGLSVFNITPTSANVQWDAIGDAIGYKITYHPAGTPSKIQKPSTDNSKLLKNLTPDTKYKWAVQTVCANNPLIASTYVIGPNFTTPPLRLGEEASGLPDMEIFPNPASESATISFSLSESSPVMIRLMNISDEVIYGIENATYPSGSHQVSFITEEIPAGAYMLQLTTDEEVITKKLMIER